MAKERCTSLATVLTIKTHRRRVYLRVTFIALLLVGATPQVRIVASHESPLMILDLINFTHSNRCCERTKQMRESGECPFPFKSWQKYLSCKDWQPSCFEDASSRKMQYLQCHTRYFRRPCIVTGDFSRANESHAVLLAHTAFPEHVLGLQQQLHEMLYPTEREANKQLWGLQIMWESSVYYPMGASIEALAYFNYTWGSGRYVMDYKMSYPPDWTRMRQPLDLDMRAERAMQYNTSSPVLLIVSNCNSKSNREAYIRDFMSHINVDSYGKCFHNKDMGELSFNSNNTNFRQVYASEGKKELISAYKFQLVIENSIEPLYVTEKIFHAWEAGAVPLYLGAPEIERFVPGPNSYIDLRRFSAHAAALLVRQLDSDVKMYMKYHSWRRKLSDTQHTGPFGHLGEMYELSSKTDPYCRICYLLQNTNKFKTRQSRLVHALGSH